MQFELRQGRWEDVLSNVEVDVIVTDPPYGARTHSGHNEAPLGDHRLPLGFEHWTPDHVHAFVRDWSPRCRGWMVALTSHDLISAWEGAYLEAGRKVFAPVVILTDYQTVRLRGDGPASWAVYCMVARPRSDPFAKWGALPGGYHFRRSLREGMTGGKSLACMRQLVTDYSRPGDCVCDPCAGQASTLITAVNAGRIALGAEVNPDTFFEAVQRIREHGFEVTLDSAATVALAEARQLDLETWLATL